MRLSWRLLLLFGCALLCEPLRAQFHREYIFVAPTVTEGPGIPVNSAFGILPPSPLASVPPPGDNSYSAGGGFEFLGKHLGVGLDLAAILPGQGKVFSNTIAAVSPNVYFHFLSTRKADLYVTGGYTLLAQSFTANAVNAGIGLNYWFRENVGLTIEGRSIFVPSYKWPNPPDNHYTQIRFGLTFR